MNGKHYFLIFSLVAGILLGAAAIISYVEDPGGAFTHNTYEKGVADILLSGHNVGNIENYDERLLQKNLIQNDQRQTDMIVLGSSRSMQIHNSPSISQDANNQTFFNHGVSGATIEDYIAILELYFEKGSTPHTIIIGVDPWILNANNDQKRWTMLKQEYQNGIARFDSIHVTPVLSQQDLGIERYASLISRPVVIESINRLLNKQNQTSYFQTDSEELDVPIKLKDGSISYPSNIRNRTVEQIDTDASNYANSDPIYSLSHFTQLDKLSKFLFESTIHYLKGRNATIILFLPPYHPIVYNKMTIDPQYSKVKEVEFYFKEFASKENITIVGSYNPNRMNLTSMDFYDGMHPRREVIDKIFSAGIIMKQKVSGG